MNENTNTCPICPRHCDLSAPHCGRGAEYAKTGELPQNNGHDGGHGHGDGHHHGSGHGHGDGHGHDHGHGPRLQFEKREQQLVMKYLHHAVGAADRGGLTQENAKDMFTVLTEEETLQLAGLLEKLSDHWMDLAPNKHGKPSPDEAGIQ